MDRIGSDLIFIGPVSDRVGSDRNDWYVEVGLVAEIIEYIQLLPMRKRMVFESEVVEYIQLLPIQKHMVFASEVVRYIQLLPMQNHMLFDTEVIESV